MIKYIALRIGSGNPWICGVDGAAGGLFGVPKGAGIVARTRLSGSVLLARAVFLWWCLTGVMGAMDFA